MMVGSGYGPWLSAGLRGRSGECAVLDNLITEVRRGESRSLLLVGEAGVGKTALLQHLVAQATDLQIIRAVGVESDMELAYASLHQLCAPLFGELDKIPAPQRTALEIVFGMHEGAPPDRFLVGLAVLSLLDVFSNQRPVLCVIDDAQWLDQSSALTLAFVSRRLLAEPVGVVLAARERTEALQHVPELVIAGVTNGDARALLNSALTIKIDERVRDRIIAETRGNPLALLELPKGLTATELAGGFGVLGSTGLSGRIEDSFLARFNLLPPETRKLLLIASAEPVGDPLLVWRACASVGIEPSAADPAEREGLLAIGQRVAFRHPLVRSAVYRSASNEDRRAAHKALAEATDAAVDPDRRAWHLASAAAGPDEEVARELEKSAGRAQARGGLAAAAAFLERAVQLTLDPEVRVERALAAAEASIQAGAFETAVSLLAAAAHGPTSPMQRARSDMMRGQIAFAMGQLIDAPRLLLRAARRLEPLDMDLSRETYLTAWGAAGLSENPVAREFLVEISRAARSLPMLTGSPRPVDLLLDGLALLITEGHAAAAPRLKQAMQALEDMPVADVLRWGWMAIGPPSATWDHYYWLSIAERQVQELRDAGALAALPVHLTYLGMAIMWTGDFAGAASVIAEMESVSAVTGSRFPPYIIWRMAALQGKEGEASMTIDRALAEAYAENMTGARAHWAAAVLNLGLGQYQEAVTAASAAIDGAVNHWMLMWVLPDLVEAAVRVGDRDLAAAALARLVETTRPSSTSFALGMEARCRAQLADGDQADALFREAIDHLSQTLLRPELARAHLLYGEWLRREGRRVDAREELRTAYEQLDAMGMEAFAERARVELQATGERPRRRTVETQEDLTAQERQIARLARDGLSNPEIGARLFLSPRTIEWHLHNVFAKLGIRSRRELPGTLGGPDVDGSAV